MSYLNPEDMVYSEQEAPVLPVNLVVEFLKPSPDFCCFSNGYLQYRFTSFFMVVFYYRFLGCARVRAFSSGEVRLP